MTISIFITVTGRIAGINNYPRTLAILAGCDSLFMGLIQNIISEGVVSFTSCLD